MYSIQITPDLTGVVSLTAYGFGWIYGIFSTPVVLVLSFALIYAGLPVILPVILLYAIFGFFSLVFPYLSLFPGFFDLFYLNPLNVFRLGIGHAICALCCTLVWGDPAILVLIAPLIISVAISLFKVTLCGINRLEQEEHEDLEKVLVSEMKEEIV